MKEFRITNVPQMFGHEFEFRLFDYDKQAYAENIIMRTVEKNESTAVPSLFKFDKDELVNLMDQLWNLGIRPSNGSGDANAFEAIKYHLEDMRRLVFKEKK